MVSIYTMLIQHGPRHDARMLLARASVVVRSFMSRILTMRATMRLAADRLLKMLRNLIVIPSDGEPWIAREPPGRAEALARLLNDYRRELNADEYLWNACNQLAEECVAAKGKNTSPEQDGCLHLRDGSKPHAPILIYLLMAIEWLDAVDKDRPAKVVLNEVSDQITITTTPMNDVEQADTSPRVAANENEGATTTGVRRDPESVHDAIENYRGALQQDVDRLRMLIPSLVHHQWPNHETVSAVDYLRSLLIIPQTRESDSSTAAWHPFILDFIRTLGVNADAVDRLFQRLVAGDVRDRRAVEFEAAQGFVQLSRAIELARQLWFAGEPVIRRVEQGVTDDTYLKVTLEQMSWLVGGNPSVRTMNNRKNDGRPPPIRKETGTRSIWRYSELANWVKHLWPARIVPTEDKAKEQLASRPTVQQ